MERMYMGNVRGGRGDGGEGRRKERRDDDIQYGNQGKRRLNIGRRKNYNVENKGGGGRDLGWVCEWVRNNSYTKWT